MEKLNIGFDFGSTYSLMGVLDPDNGGLHCISLDVGTPYIPSVVAYDPEKNKYKYGAAAKGVTGNAKKKVYSAFKTLLNSNLNDEVVRQRGYDSQHSPEQISKLFIEQQLGKAMNNMGFDCIETLCIGIPEVWGKSFRISDSQHSVSQAIGKKHIEDVLNSIKFVKKSIVVTEPQAASAFFVHNYNKTKKADLNGKLLIVDYGGGTLDITLSEVSAAGNASNMKIKVIDSKGAGENINGQVGNAGILFIESLLKLAMANAGIKEPEMNAGFAALSVRVEQTLRNEADDIKEVFAECDPSQKANLEMLADTPFMDELEYKDANGEVSEFTITYADLYDAYKENIYPTLDNLLERIIKDNDVKYTDPSFKLGLVGGFCNFCLVENQIYEKFNISSGNDPRVSGLLSNPEDKEKAIALGATLLSNGRVSLVDTAEFAMGVYAKINDRLFYNYGIWYRQEIRPQTTYFIRDKNNVRYMIRSANGDLDKLLIKFDPDDKNAFEMTPKSQFREKLHNVITSPQRTAFVGFSITPEGIICIHIQECDAARNPIGDEKVIELTDFDNMFDPTILT